MVRPATSRRARHGTNETLNIERKTISAGASRVDPTGPLPGPFLLSTGGNPLRACTLRCSDGPRVLAFKRGRAVPSPTHFAVEDRSHRGAVVGLRLALGRSFLWERSLTANRALQALPRLRLGSRSRTAPTAASLLKGANPTYGKQDPPLAVGTPKAARRVSGNATNQVGRPKGRQRRHEVSSHGHCSRRTP